MCVFSLCYCLVISTSANDCMERIVHLQNYLLRALHTNSLSPVSLLKLHRQLVCLLLQAKHAMAWDVPESCVGAASIAMTSYNVKGPCRPKPIVKPIRAISICNRQPRDAGMHCLSTVTIIYNRKNCHSTKLQFVLLVNRNPSFCSRRYYALATTFLPGGSKSENIWHFVHSTYRGRPCVTHHWHWLSFVRS